MRRWTLALVTWLTAGCVDEPASNAAELIDPTTLGPLAAEVAYALPSRDVDAGVDELVCVSITLNNEETLYVNGVRSLNEGGFHHGNWFVVPDDLFPGDDGYWDCDERGYEELSTAMAGTVLFAQSTQARREEQRFEEGTVVVVPPRSKIVADVHFLNASPRPISTRQWLTLELIHPFEVQAVLLPALLSYVDLRIPAQAQTMHRTRCESDGGRPWPEMTLHYVLPHYHGFGNRFELSTVDPAGRSEVVFEVQGFDASSLGHTFDPPVEIAEGGGLGFGCGHNNWSSEDLFWGLGDGEMCVALVLADSTAVVLGGVLDDSQLTNVEDDVLIYEAACQWAAIPRGSAYTLPTDGARGRPMYLPPAAGGPPPPPIPACVDTNPLAEPIAEPTLDNLRRYVFEPSCTFSSCHGDARVAGLDLRADDLRAQLLGHSMRRATDKPLVAPGDPDGSYLLDILSRCDGDPLGPPMPLGAPTLLDDELVAMLRAWIAGLV